MNQLILPGVNVREIAKNIANKHVTLWLPEKRLRIHPREIKFDERKLEVDHNLHTRADKFDRVCLLCANQQDCTHYLSNQIPCFWCRRKFSGESIGIPIRWDSIKKEGRQLRRLFLYGKYCSYNCAYADLCDNLSKNCQKKYLFSQSENLLKHLFACNYPGETLQAAPHWTLLDINGGPLSEEKFTDNYFLYQPIANYVRFGIELEYIRKINYLHKHD